MNRLDQVLSEMDFNFFGSGAHGMNMIGMRKALGNDHFVFLDVRSEKEVKYTFFPFALHIPLNRLPERLGELPKDKMIVTFCSSVFRGAIACIFLRANGFREVKGLTASMEEMIMAFKPGPLANL